MVTLQLSKQRVPRWLTEGISEYEEQRARPEWGRQMQVQFAEAMERGDVVPLAELNQAFSDPERITLAYYQASLVVEHIIAAHGEEGAAPPAARVRRGARHRHRDPRSRSACRWLRCRSRSPRLSTRRFAPVRAALALPEDGDPAAARRRCRRCARWRPSHPGSYPLQMAVAQVLQDAGERDGAMTAYDGGRGAVPVTHRVPRARWRLLAKLALEAGDRPRAAAALERLIARDGDNVEAARQLVTLLDNPADAGRQLRAAGTRRRTRSVRCGGAHSARTTGPG